MKAMRAMKKKSIIATGRLAKVMVLRGSKVKTVGGLKASDLTKNKTGRVVSKKRSAHGKKNAWIQSVMAARTHLKIKGFCAIKKGSELHTQATIYHPNMIYNQKREIRNQMAIEKQVRHRTTWRQNPCVGLRGPYQGSDAWLSEELGDGSHLQCKLRHLFKP